MGSSTDFVVSAAVSPFVSRLHACDCLLTCQRSMRAGTHRSSLRRCVLDLGLHDA